MNRAGFVRKAIAAAFMIVGSALMVETPLLAQAPAGGGSSMALAYLGAAIGLGMVVIGAGLGIGRFAAAAAESIARQPAAADKITGAVNLPLFLLEGVAIIGEVGILLVVLK
jgi:F-type H+-transporting ATPase subunit c